MLAYVALGTNDIERAAGFYNALLSLLDAKLVMDNENAKAWKAPEGAMLLVLKPGDGKPATIGNGCMVSLQAPTKELVDRVYECALELGGKDEGGPQDRDMGGKTSRVAYFRDLDGHKLDVLWAEA